MMEIDWVLDGKIVDAQDRVFTWMATLKVPYDRALGSKTLRVQAGADWADAWENWWDEVSED